MRITQCYLPPDTSERVPPNPSHAGWYSIHLPRRDGRLSWHSWLDSAPAGSGTSDLSITSPMPNRCTSLKCIVNYIFTHHHFASVSTGMLSCVVQDSLVNNSQMKLKNDAGRKNIRAPSCDPDSLARLPSNQLSKCSSLSQYTFYCIRSFIVNNEIIIIIIIIHRVSKNCANLFFAPMPVWVHCCKRPIYDFCISQGSVATVLRWGGQKYSHLSCVSSWCCVPKIIRVGQYFTELFKKQHWHSFFETRCS